ncbi:DUF72 domain-containing protein [Candidatus Bathyarchaeota archaeon]|nr:DUF72 domain-containing protein [Candidatus Bathyarchaeota archaeon]
MGLEEDQGQDNVLLGTSGWSYEEWVGLFYTERKKMFSEYTRVFRTSEINSTFYTYPSPGLVYGLTRGSPKNFVFAAKLPQLITHKKKLALSEGVKDDLERFLDLMKPMNNAGKLGAVLIQLPPEFSFNEIERLSRFLALLPDSYRFAVEFRNVSWIRDETWRLLKEHNVAYTVVDEPLLPPNMVLTADFAYIRWHGRHTHPWFDYRYSEKELEEWVPKVKEAAEKTKKVYGYFNNHFHGYAPENCVQILEKLGMATRLQTKVKNRIQAYIAGKQAELPIEVVQMSMKEVMKLGLSQLLREFTDAGRIDRAETIKQPDVSFKEATENRIFANVKEYEVHIDPINKVIRHTCEDWTKQHQEKKICKHVVRVFLSLPLNFSKEILADMVVNKEQWRFEPLSKGKQLTL